MSLLLFGTGEVESMAITYVNGDISTSDNVSTVTGVSWTGLGHASGDIAFSIWALLTTATTVAQDGNLTTIEDHTDQNLRSFLSKRTMTGSESGTISYTVDGASLNRMAVALAIYRGVGTVGTAVRFTEGGTADDVHPVANNLSITPTADNALILLVYSERSSTGNTAGTLAAPTGPGGGSATIRVERGTGNSGGTYVQIADFQLGAGTSGVAQNFTQWDATPDTLIASNCDMWLVPLYPAATAVTGTVAVTQAADTSAASGQLGYTGSSAATQAAQTSSATGTVAGPVTGTAAPNQASQTASAAGQLGYSGTATPSQAAQTSTATGKLGYSGTSAVAQANQSAAASGQLGYAGSAAANQAANTASASGVFTAGGAIAGSAAVTQANQTSAAAGKLGYSGSATASQANQTSTATGKLGYTGTSTATQAANAGSAAGTDTAPVTGSAAATQANQTATASGILRYIATGATSQASNKSAASGVFFVPVTGTALVIQANQTASASGSSLGSIVIRPDTGRTTRTASGITPRPFTTTTPRP